MCNNYCLLGLLISLTGKHFIIAIAINVNNNDTISIELLMLVLYALYTSCYNPVFRNQTSYKEKAFGTIS